MMSISRGLAGLVKQGERPRAREVPVDPHRAGGDGGTAVISGVPLLI
jgi:hypothetical protein